MLFADRHELFGKTVSRDQWMYMLMLAVSAYFGLEFIMQWKVPDIYDIVEIMFGDLAKLLVKLLKP
ncbi:MAG: hypothetical protein K0S39_4578 [Paenibacillus sp.]|jgi:hypothetical protein|nr:hypothetical protein [Paenibacillus sp.]